MLHVLLRNARAIVTDLEEDVLVRAAEQDRHGAALGRVVDCVVKQIHEDLREQNAVRPEQKQLIRYFCRETVSGGVSFHMRDRARDDLLRRLLLEVQAKPALVEPGHIEDIFDKVAEPARVVVDIL